MVMMPSIVRRVVTIHALSRRTVTGEGDMCRCPWAMPTVAMYDAADQSWGWLGEGGEVVWSSVFEATALYPGQVSEISHQI